MRVFAGYHFQLTDVCARLILELPMHFCFIDKRRVLSCHIQILCFRHLRMLFTCRVIWVSRMTEPHFLTHAPKPFRPVFSIFVFFRRIATHEVAKLICRVYREEMRSSLALSLCRAAFLANTPQRQMICHCP